MASLYIHVPFCKTICKYCDFCKVYINNEWICKYLYRLEHEIFESYKGENLDTIYIGGGTPNSLNESDFEKLLLIVDKLNKNYTYEYTIECNVELLTIEQILLMKKYGVNRISIGIQTFHEKFMVFLNRHHSIDEVQSKIRLLRENGFNNINVDMMYAFPGESLDEVIEDVHNFQSLHVEHISTYSLIIEPHTILHNMNIETIDEDLDALMYETIDKMLSNYNHYEISNFAKHGFESRHNLTYWDNLEYYGFGLGASGYINGIRYTNTRNLNQYLDGNCILEKHKLSKKEDMENEMMLGLRKLQGVSISKFKSKYGIDIRDVFDIGKMINSKRLIIDQDYLKINKEYIYISNEILVYFIGSDDSE